MLNTHGYNEGLEEQCANLYSARGHFGAVISMKITSSSWVVLGIFKLGDRVLTFPTSLRTYHLETLSGNPRLFVLFRSHDFSEDITSYYHASKAQ